MLKLTVVVVTYKKDFLTTPSAQLLLDFAKRGLLQLIIYDNRYTAKKIQNANTINIQTEDNDGLSIAYNKALEAAKKVSSKWLLLLDHDTTITENYINDILSISEDGIKAILPIVVSKGEVVSPLNADGYISLRTKKIPELGLSANQLMAINSGTALSVKIMTNIGGFNEQFSLDFLDHWLFWRLNTETELKYMITSEKINHELSVQEPNKMMFERYIGILEAETIFYTEYNRVQLSGYIKNLLLRGIKQCLLVRDRRFWKVTLRQYIKLIRRVNR